MYGVSGQTKRIEDMRLPPNVRVSAVRENERRVVAVGAHRDEAHIVTLTDPPTFVKLLPDDLDDVDLLVLGLDEGACGCAGIAFAQDPHLAKTPTALHRRPRNRAVGPFRSHSGPRCKLARTIAP